MIFPFCYFFYGHEIALTVQIRVTIVLFLGGYNSAQHYRYALHRLSPTSDFCVSALSVGTLTGSTFLIFRSSCYAVYLLEIRRFGFSHAVLRDFSVQYRVIAYILMQVIFQLAI